jgi:hypothetical protein
VCVCVCVCVCSSSTMDEKDLSSIIRDINRTLSKKKKKNSEQNLQDEKAQEQRHGVCTCEFI